MKLFMIKKIELLESVLKARQGAQKAKMLRVELGDDR